MVDQREDISGNQTYLVGGGEWNGPTGNLACGWNFRNWWNCCCCCCCCCCCGCWQQPKKGFSVGAKQGSMRSRDSWNVDQMLTTWPPVLKHKDEEPNTRPKNWQWDNFFNLSWSYESASIAWRAWSLTRDGSKLMTTLAQWSIWTIRFMTRWGYKLWVLHTNKKILSFI